MLQYHGVEINEKAIILLRENYPKLKDNRHINSGAVEDVIKNYSDEFFDCVFTMAVLMHIHPDSNWIFKEIARITKKYILTVENEEATNVWRIFPRNYKIIFENLGFKQIKEIKCEGTLKDYTFRLFKRK